MENPFKPYLRPGFILALLVAGAAVFTSMISAFVSGLVLSAVFAGLLYPVQRWTCTRLGGRHNLAAGLVLIGALVAVGLPLVVLAGMIVIETVEVSEKLKPFVENALSGDVPISERVPEWLPFLNLIEPYQDTIRERLSGAAGTAGSWLVQNIATVTQSTLGFTIQLFVALYALFYFLTDGPRLIAGLKALLPLAEEDRELVLDRGLTVTKASLKGILVVGAVQGLLVAGGLWAAGIGSPAFWGAIVFVLSAVPGLGAPLVWVPAVIYLATTGETGAAIGLTVWGAVVVGLADNFLRPMLVGRDAKLPDLVVLVSILGGLATFGAMGIILGPIAAAFLDTVLNIYKRAFCDALPESE